MKVAPIYLRGCALVESERRWGALRGLGNVVETVYRFRTADGKITGWTADTDTLVYDASDLLGCSLTHTDIFCSGLPREFMNRDLSNEK